MFETCMSQHMQIVKSKTQTYFTTPIKILGRTNRDASGTVCLLVLKHMCAYNFYNLSQLELFVFNVHLSDGECMENYSSLFAQCTIKRNKSLAIVNAEMHVEAMVMCL